MGGGRFSFHFPFHLSTHRRAREGGEPLFLNQTGKIVQRPGLAPVTRERGLSGVQRSGLDELWNEVRDIVQGSRPLPWKRNAIFLFSDYILKVNWIIFL